MWPSNGLISTDQMFMQEMKVCAVNYQLNANKRIRSLQLVFHNGKMSKQFEPPLTSRRPTTPRKTLPGKNRAVSPRGNYEWITAELDYQDRLSLIEIWVA